jgi:hypothetical protein
MEVIKYCKPQFFHPILFPLTISVMPSKHAMRKGKWAHCFDSTQSYACI